MGVRLIQYRPKHGQSIYQAGSPTIRNEPFLRRSVKAGHGHVSVGGIDEEGRRKLIRQILAQQMAWELEQNQSVLANMQVANLAEIIHREYQAQQLAWDNLIAGEDEELMSLL